MTYTTSKRIIFLCFLLALMNVQADLPTIQADSSVKEVMLGMTIPASDYIWSIQEQPEDEAVWDLVRLNADKLAQSANLLLDESRSETSAADRVVADARASAEAVLAAAAQIENIADQIESA